MRRFYSFLRDEFVGPTLQLSRFGPREERESKRIRRWAEVGSSEKLGREIRRDRPDAVWAYPGFVDRVNVGSDDDRLTSFELNW